MDKKSIDDFFNAIGSSRTGFKGYKVIICPPFVYIDYCIRLCATLGLNFIEFGSQDLSQFPSGAYTGDVSSSMVVDIGAKYCLIGHSERRKYFGDEHNSLSQKLINATTTGLRPIYCIGETLEELESAQFEKVITQQIKALDGIVKKQDITIAYEPVWAIGTGKTPTMSEIATRQDFIKQALKQAYKMDFLVLYGGSVNEKNFNEIIKIPSLDGVLVGGASMKAENVIEWVRSHKDN